ncbi:hypothetical protein BDW71DRAFT_113945 [Aspergillus fruticulosus]
MDSRCSPWKPPARHRHPLGSASHVQVPTLVFPNGLDSANDQGRLLFFSQSDLRTTSFLQVWVIISATLLSTYCDKKRDKGGKLGRDLIDSYESSFARGGLCGFCAVLPIGRANYSGSFAMDSVPF